MSDTIAPAPYRFSVREELSKIQERVRYKMDRTQEHVPVSEYFGNLTFDRFAISVGRDLDLEPPQMGAPLNYFVYPYAEANGEKVGGMEANFQVVVVE